MRAYLILAAVFGLCYSASMPSAMADGPPALAVRLHFSGTTQLLSDTNRAVRLNWLAGLPETAALENDILRKLSTAPYRYLQDREKRLTSTSRDESGRLRPLLDDLLHNESYLEVWNSTNDAVPEVLLAVHLTDARAALWQKNLSSVLTSWTGLPIEKISVQGYPGWELRKHRPPNLIHFIQAGDWTIFDWGQDELVSQADMIQRIKDQGRPVETLTTNWLEASVNWPLLLVQHPALAASQWPTMQISCDLKDDNLRSSAVLKFPAPLNLPVTPWDLPTNLVRSPLVQFSAARGAAPWLNRFKFFRDLKLNPLPNQFYTWSMAGPVFESYLAVQVADSANYLARFGPQLMAVANPLIEPKGLGGLRWNIKHNGLWWAGMPPMVSPTLGAVDKTNGDFILGGLFPSRQSSIPAPDALYQEITVNPDLTFYDWEMTGPHVIETRGLLGLYYIGQHIPISDQSVPVNQWIDAARPRLGNCVTEARLTGPDELTVTRKSSVGLSALELALLARWEDAPGFPLDATYTWDYDSAPPPVKKPAPTPIPHPRPGATNHLNQPVVPRAPGPPIPPRQAQ